MGGLLADAAGQRHRPSQIREGLRVPGGRRFNYTFRIATCRDAAMSRISSLCLCVSLLLLLSAPASAGKRLALVIGNGNYSTVDPLKNPANDAKAVGQSLRDLGFGVTLAIDAGKADFERTIRDFADSLAGADAAVFYYAGHGLQVDGRNYMVPVDARLSDEADLPFQLVALDIVLQRLAHHRITNIVIMDACRDNPLGDKLSKALSQRSDAVGSGLANVYASAGTLISYSTQPHHVALDGDGDNSLYSGALARHMSTPDIDVLDMLKRVRRDVYERTNKAQLPWDNHALIDDFFFKDTAGSKDKSGPDRDRVQPPGDRQAIVVPPDRDAVLTGKPPVHPCDIIAGSASDPERVTRGVTMGELNGPDGVKACRAALARYPNTPRFEFQLARALQKSGANVEAAALYRSLVERGYFAALTNYGWMLNGGLGVAKDQKAAVRLYLLAAQQGDNFGMFNTAMAYDSGEGLPYDPRQAARWIYAAIRLGHDYSVRMMVQRPDGWTRDFRIELQRLLQRAGAYDGPLDGNLGPGVETALRRVKDLPFAPTPGGNVPKERFDATTIPVNAPLPPR